MTENKFNELSSIQKMGVFVAAFIAVLAGGYYIQHWFVTIYRWLHNTLPAWGAVVVSVIIFLFLFFVVSIITWFTRTFIIKLFKRGQKKSITFSEDEFMSKEESDTYRSDKGIGEIEFYWGNRKEANDDIKEYLKNTTSSNIFISAIGFSTISDVLSDPGVLENFTNLLTQSQSAFKISIVFPNKADIRLRPDKEEKELKESINNCFITLKNFKNNLTQKAIAKLKGDEAINFKIDKYLTFETYTEHILPRHFILQSDSSILVGSYLSHQKGSKSYLMKLRNFSGNHQKPGIYNLFLNEIDYIQEHSQPCQLD